MSTTVSETEWKTLVASMTDLRAAGDVEQEAKQAVEVARAAQNVAEDVLKAARQDAAQRAPGTPDPALTAASARATASALALKQAIAEVEKKHADTFLKWLTAFQDYRTRLNGFLRHNEDEFYVLGPQFKTDDKNKFLTDGALERNSLLALDVRFGSTPASASIDRLLALFGLDAVLEESNALKYRSNMYQRLDSAAASLDAYRDKLLGNFGSIDKAANTWLITGAPVVVPPGAVAPNPAMVQLTALARVAEELARLEPPVTKGMLKFEAAALQASLEHAGSAIVRLSVLARALRDQAIRDQITQRLRPVAQVYQDNAGRPLAPLVGIWWLFVAGMLGSAAVLVAANVLSPAFGPILTFGFVFTPVALAIGVWLVTNNNFGVKWARTQKDTLRKYMVETLRGTPNGPDDLDILRALSGVFPFVERRPITNAVSAPINWFKGMVTRSGPAPSERTAPDEAALQPVVETDWTKVSTGRLDEALNPANEPLIPFKKGTPKKWRGAIFGYALICLLLAAVVDSIQVALPWLSALAFPVVAEFSAVKAGDNDPLKWARDVAAKATLPAQVLRNTVGRESCEVASGNLVWQDEARVFLVNATGAIVSIARNDTSEVRFGDSHIDAKPCGTQSGMFADSDTTIANSSPVTVTVPVTVAGGGGDGQTTTMLNFQSNVVLDGQQITVNPDVADKRYVILPLALNPVQGLGTGSPTADEYLRRAYQLYFDDELAKDTDTTKDRRQFHDEMVAAIRPIAQALHASAQAGCMIEIAVKGFASDSVFSTGGAEANYLLAEGRRAAALWELGFRNPVTPDAPAKVQLKADPEDRGARVMLSPFWATLTEIRYESGGGLRLIQDTPDINEKVYPMMVWSPQYQDMQGVTDGLAEWYAEPAKATRRLQESIARSVVIEISDKDMLCAGDPKAPEQLAKTSITTEGTAG